MRSILISSSLFIMVSAIGLSQETTTTPSKDEVLITSKDSVVRPTTVEPQNSVKSKTKSNQSNERTIVIKDSLETIQTNDAQVKVKTKSNQSNDRVIVKKDSLGKKLF